MAGILCCSSVQTSLTRSKVRRSLLSLSLRSVNSDSQFPAEIQVVALKSFWSALTLLEESLGQLFQLEASGKQQGNLFILRLADLTAVQSHLPSGLWRKLPAGHCEAAQAQARSSAQV